MTNNSLRPEFMRTQPESSLETAGMAAARAALGIFDRRSDLLREFLDAPFGRHSADLRFILDVMRSQPMAGKWFTIMTKPFSEWRAARWSPDGHATETAPTSFHSREDVERWVFKQRWRDLIGTLPEEHDNA
ncbi:hypothetical protein NKH37_32220 [Mesorhizobium sp. M1217]|uniref:hypothetical protein n=2 Tax=unclassified Mesorhizobium TaxID=325217 RepID=UPI003335DDFE